MQKPAISRDKPLPSIEVLTRNQSGDDIAKCDLMMHAGYGGLATLEESHNVSCFICLLELGRYRYLESVSVFGIFVGIFSCRFGILKYLGIRYRLSTQDYCLCSPYEPT